MARPKKGQEHPREEVAKRVRMLVAIGVNQKEICGLLRVSFSTLQQFYKVDLELGAAEAAEVVGGTIFQAAKAGESWACSLWAARRMGWKETNVTEVTAPIPVISRTSLTPEEWEVEANKLVKSDEG